MLQVTLYWRKQAVIRCKAQQIGQTKFFIPTYPLQSLIEVEKYVTTNQHLPGIPSAVEVVKQRVEVIKMEAKLLEKLEELTLYLIQQQKRIEQLENRIEQISKP